MWQATLLNSKNKYFGYRKKSNSCWIFVGRYVVVGQQVGHLLVPQHHFLLRSEHTKTTTLCTESPHLYLIMERNDQHSISVYTEVDTHTYSFMQKTTFQRASCFLFLLRGFRNAGYSPFWELDVFDGVGQRHASGLRKQQHQTAGHERQRAWTSQDEIFSTLKTQKSFANNLRFTSWFITSQLNWFLTVLNEQICISNDERSSFWM